MIAVDAGILAAWILGGATLTAAMVGGPMMHFLRKLDRRNTADHDKNREMGHRILERLDDVQKDVEEVKAVGKDNGHMISSHIAWHAHTQEPKEAS